MQAASEGKMLKLCKLESEKTLSYCSLIHSDRHQLTTRSDGKLMGAKFTHMTRIVADTNVSKIGHVFMKVVVAWL